LVILAFTVFDWSTHVTDRQTDKIAMAKMRYSACYHTLQNRGVCVVIGYLLLIIMVVAIE